MHSLKSEKGKWVLVYFYPKDDTPGCTAEACGFRDLFQEITRKGVRILGISKDSVASHKKFAGNFAIPFPLLSDLDEKVIKAYGVWGEKHFMGKTYMGILRMSYLIEPKGKIVKVYEKVDPEEHAQEVLKDLENFQ